MVDEIEKRFKAFQPAKYDVTRQLKAIEAFEVEAVKNAEATKEKVDLELKDLQATLTNIETARPFEELTVDEVCAAEPSIDEKTAKLVSKGRWTVPGYKVLLLSYMLPPFRYTLLTPMIRRNSATFPYYRQHAHRNQSNYSLSLVYSSIVDRRAEGEVQVGSGNKSSTLFIRFTCPGCVG